MVSTKCIVPVCIKGPKFRGLCNSHYATAKMLVKANRTTWAKLAEQGKALPPKRERSTNATAFFLSDEPVAPTAPVVAVPPA